MPSPRPITIVGGGLAGLTLGIGLRQCDVPVVIWEAGEYPRHKVCGEFVSGRGLKVLERLGQLPRFFERGARIAHDTAFFCENMTPAKRPLSETALCFSRFEMDALLAAEFSRLGGELRLNSRWPRQDFAPGVVRATGRRPRATTTGWRWFGLKVHATNVQLDADLEMHSGSNGYVGLCRLSGDRVNICGLFRTRATVPDLRERWLDWITGSNQDCLKRRLEKAVFDPGSFSSIAAISLRPGRAAALPELCIGDALTMIPPVTGNGMSMSFESAEFAIEPLADYSAGRISWGEARQISAQKCDRAFRRRLSWAGWLQSALFQGATRKVLMLLARRCPAVWECFYQRTR